MQEKCYSYLKMFKREKKNFAVLYCNHEICNVLNVFAKVFLSGYTFRPLKAKSWSTLPYANCWEYMYKLYVYQLRNLAESS